MIGSNSVGRSQNTIKKFWKRKLKIKCWCFHAVASTFKGVISAKMVKIIKFLFFAQKASSGMGALRPKFLGG